MLIDKKDKKLLKHDQGNDLSCRLIQRALRRKPTYSGEETVHKRCNPIIDKRHHASAAITLSQEMLMQMKRQRNRQRKDLWNGN